jgi:hypothetical protein
MQSSIFIYIAGNDHTIKEIITRSQYICGSGDACYFVSYD